MHVLTVLIIGTRGESLGFTLLSFQLILYQLLRDLHYLIVLYINRLQGGGWFFRAILIFYLILYGLSHFSVKNLRIILSVTIIGLLASSFFLIKSPEDVYSSGSYYAWGVYFTTFLFGFICGKGSILNKKHVTYKGIVILIICITMYYGYLACCNRFSELLWLRILSIFPLYGILVFFYLSCDSTNASKLLTSKYNFPIIFISSLCWEIYLAQLFIVLPYPGLFTRNLPLPINIFATFALILVVAYVIKVLSRFIIQIFSRDKFDWTYMVQIWKR